MQGRGSLHLRSCGCTGSQPPRPRHAPTLCHRCTRRRPACCAVLCRMYNVFGWKGDIRNMIGIEDVEANRVGGPAPLVAPLEGR